MRKIVLLLFLSGFLQSIKAQSTEDFTQHDFAYSYGVVTSNQIINVLTDIAVAIVSFGNVERELQGFSGGHFLTYEYRAMDQLSFAFCGGIDKAHGNLLDPDDIIRGSYRNFYTTIGIATRFRYVDREWVQMYSGIGLAYTFYGYKDLLDTGEISRSDILSYPNMQFNIWSIRVGKSFGGFMELGVGYKGILNFGISYQL